MESKREALLLAVMSGISLLLSLAGLGWTLVGGLGFSLDAIFMILVCLSMAGLFALMLLVQLNSAGLLPSRKKNDTPAGAAPQSS